MNDYKRIFLDTSPIVYYLECNEAFYSKMKNFWKEQEYSDYVTSAVTVTEYLTYPYQKRNEKQIHAFYTFVDGMDIEIKEIDKVVAEKAEGAGELSMGESSVGKVWLYKMAEGLF